MTERPPQGVGVALGVYDQSQPESCNCRFRISSDGASRLVLRLSGSRMARIRRASERSAADLCVPLLRAPSPPARPRMGRPRLLLDLLAGHPPRGHACAACCAWRTAASGTSMAGSTSRKPTARSTRRPPRLPRSSLSAVALRLRRGAGKQQRRRGKTVPHMESVTRSLALAPTRRWPGRWWRPARQRGVAP